LPSPVRESFDSPEGDALAERRRLIRKAGRPDLIDPATCARFGITED
jgi:hypothetical protein